MYLKSSNGSWYRQIAIEDDKTKLQYDVTIAIHDSNKDRFVDRMLVSENIFLLILSLAESR